MKTVWLIAQAEWRLMRRNRVAMLGLIMLLALSAVSVLTSMAQRDASDALRARFQQQANAAFDGAPARHPHRMVHYGHFVFRPLTPLAAFDPGVDAFTGNTIYLEGHRQNSANFGDVRQSSLLVRFGQLTPAFVLQSLAPLMLIFLGFGTLAGERQQGTLKQLFAHGATGRSVLAGKVLSLSVVVGLMLLPALLALSWLTVAGDAPLLPVLVLIGGYGAYLGIWVLLVVLMSAFATQARTALMTLFGLWAFTVILLPRIAPDIALGAQPLKTRLETDIDIAAALHKIGDSHNPDDPFYAQFKARVLQEYGVQRVEDLPVNYRGLLAVEGEKLTSRLFDEYASQLFAAQRKQSTLTDAFGVFSPVIAVRRLSMAAAGTDLEGHRRFLEQSEAYRFRIVQQLNQLQATAITYQDDGSRNSDPEAARRVRIDPQHWQDIPEFAYQPAGIDEQLRAALLGGAMLIGWLLALCVVWRMAQRRLSVTS